jgi:hypothetical protein
MPADQGTAHEQQTSTDLLELRVTVGALVAGVEQLRQALVPLAGMPLQLQALQELHTERLANHIALHARDVADLKADQDAESGRRRSADEALERRLGLAITEVKDWQTWAMRVVFGLVIAAVLGVVLVAP